MKTQHYATSLKEARERKSVTDYEELSPRDQELIDKLIANEKLIK